MSTIQVPIQMFLSKISIHLTTLKLQRISQIQMQKAL